ncbi:hypothetical protein BGX20_003784 [Mortierella sp. AD010]|nr:hypothetical protein BGX20_003784 [Mortierella sp. AD010]
MINDDGVIEIQNPEGEASCKKLNDLKITKPSLRTAATIGGRDMVMAHCSEMASTLADRQKFIRSAIDYVRKYNRKDS